MNGGSAAGSAGVADQSGYRVAVWVGDLRWEHVDLRDRQRDSLSISLSEVVYGTKRFGYAQIIDVDDT
jgi:hypothetical protein